MGHAVGGCLTTVLSCLLHREMLQLTGALRTASLAMLLSSVSIVKLLASESVVRTRITRHLSAQELTIVAGAAAEWRI